MNALVTFGLGLCGAALGQILQYIYMQREGSPFRYGRAVVITVLASVWTTIYFLAFEGHFAGALGYLLISHYGLFASLAGEEVTGASGSSAKPTPVPAAIQATPLGPVLVLNGFWPVYGVGTLGAFLSELLALYRQRNRRKAYSPFYWIVTVLMILAGGLITVFYGVSNVSALLALQLGASAPLIIGRLRR